MSVALLGLGAAMVVVYAVALAGRYPLFVGLQDPRSNWARIPGATIPSFAIHLALYLAVTLLYWGATHLLTGAIKAQVQVRYVAWITLGVWLAASAVLWGVSPAGDARDIYDYLFRGRMLVEFGASPLAQTPNAFPDAPFYAYITWTDHVDTYGPLWEYASGGVALVVRSWLQLTDAWSSAQTSCPQDTHACAALLAYMTGFRLLAVALAGACGWLIFSMVRRQMPNHSREWARLALTIWLWNPLLLISTAVGAHNDMVMLALQLAAFWLLQRRRWLGGLLVLVLAAHVKLTVVVLAPVVGLWLVRQVGWRRAMLYGIGAIAGGLLISWLLYAPLGGWETLPRMLSERARYVANSFHHVAYRLLLARGLSKQTLHGLTISGPSLLAALVTVAVSIWLLGLRRVATPDPSEEDRRLWRATLVVSLLYLLLGSFWYQHWYMLWVLAPAALLPYSGFTRNVAPWLTLGSLSSNVVADYLPQLAGPPLARTGRVIAAVATTWLPAVLAAVILLARRRHVE